MAKSINPNRYAKVIGEYNDRAIDKVRPQCAGQIASLYEKFPFNGFAEKYLHILLRRYRILPNHGCYADCYSAGMMAYLYSIYRCAYMGYENVEGYIAKLLKIYLICAIVVYQDAQNLCRENDFQELRIDKMEYMQV